MSSSIVNAIHSVSNALTGVAGGFIEIVGEIIVLSVGYPVFGFVVLVTLVGFWLTKGWLARKAWNALGTLPVWGVRFFYASKKNLRAQTRRVKHEVVTNEAEYVSMEQSEVIEESQPSAPNALGSSSTDSQSQPFDPDRAFFERMRR
ncbi:hypothetical protein [Vibrio mediterranei]|uniref:hypothetical protein n=1 Tax=Vibrio mediterranei TaxID=689 RepID=UPI004068F413